MEINAPFTNTQINVSVFPEIRSLSANCLSSLIKASYLIGTINFALSFISSKKRRPID
ncbi:hypothetical protein J7J00_08885 [Bacillus sp. ISL-4]|uniref:hypothetical protein n=1 Tax=Bacillus sp. ISL-4 TaxID=2819125 RepID=UPI001BE9C0FC|nr:hypothetical protein [Bacillus sp. ISL-4]MBT2665612.1 hypothetical protein [Bacillus sp. ISL-4]